MSVHAGSSNVDEKIPDTNYASSGPVLTVLGLCGIVVALMQTLVVPIIPQLPHLLNSTPADTSWAVTATLLAAAVITPISGRLGDMFGKKRMLLVSLAMVVLGSAICAIAPSLIVLVVGRALQGASVGAIPLGIAIIRDVLPPKKVAGAMAVMSATLGVGGAIGLPIAAVIAQNANWHFLFVTSAAFGLICIALVAFVIPESTVRRPGRFDFVGALGLTVGLITLLLPITKGGTWGWGDAKTLGLLAGFRAQLPGVGMVGTSTQRTAGGPPRIGPAASSLHQLRVDRRRFCHVRQFPDAPPTAHGTDVHRLRTRTVHGCSGARTGPRRTRHDGALARLRSNFGLARPANLVDARRPRHRIGLRLRIFHGVERLAGRRGRNVHRSGRRALVLGHAGLDHGRSPHHGICSRERTELTDAIDRHVDVCRDRERRPGRNDHHRPAPQ